MTTQRQEMNVDARMAVVKVVRERNVYRTFDASFEQLVGDLCPTCDCCWNGNRMGQWIYDYLGRMKEIMIWDEKANKFYDLRMIFLSWITSSFIPFSIWQGCNSFRPHRAYCTIAWCIQSISRRILRWACWWSDAWWQVCLHVIAQQCLIQMRIMAKCGGVCTILVEHSHCVHSWIAMKDEKDR